MVLLQIILARGFSAVSQILLGLYLVSIHGASDSGSFFFVITIVNFIVILLRNGSDTFIFKELSAITSKEKGASLRLINNVYKTLIYSSLLYVIILGLLFIPSDFGLNNIDLGFIVLLFIVPVSVAILWINSAILRSRDFTLLSAIFEPAMPIGAILTIIFVFNMNGKSSLPLTSYSYAFTYLICAIASIIYVFSALSINAYNVKKGIKSLGSIKGIYSNKYSIAMLKSNISGYLINWFPVFITGLISSTSAVSLLTVAIRISQVFPFTQSIVNTILSPHIARLLKSNKSKYLLDLFVKNTLILLLISIVFWLIIWFVAKDLLVDFDLWPNGLEPVLVIIMAAQTINILTGSSSRIVSLSNSMHLIYKNNMVRASMYTIPMSTVLIYIFDITGAAISILITLAYINIKNLNLFFKLINLK